MKFNEAIQKQIDEQRTRYAKSGYEFKERTVSTHNLGDLIGAVLAIDNESDANEFYRGYIEHLESLPRHERYTPKQVADSNIGWCFGEGMAADRQQMWQKCTTASHPIFGKTQPTPEEAIRSWKTRSLASRGA